MNASSSALIPMPFAALPTRTGRQDRVADAAVEAGVELRVADLLALEVLRQHVVVGLGRGLEQLVAARGDLVGELVRDRDLDLLAALEPLGLAVDEVDVALERVAPRRSRGGAARSCCRTRARSASSAAVGSAFSRSHLLMKKQAARPGRAAERDRRLEARLDAARGVDDEQRPVGGGEALDDLGHEVRVAGRVDERDPGARRARTSRPRGSATAVRFCSSGS